MAKVQEAEDSTVLVGEESGGCRGIFWLQKSLMATEDGWLQRSLVATEDGWLQRSLVATEDSCGCREVCWQQSFSGFLGAHTYCKQYSTSNMAGTESVGTCIDGQYCGESVNTGFRQLLFELVDRQRSQRVCNIQSNGQYMNAVSGRRLVQDLSG